MDVVPLPLFTNYWLIDHLQISNLLCLNLQAISRHALLGEILCWRLGDLFFKIHFFANVIGEWNWLDIRIRGSTSFLSFKNTILKEIRPSPNSIFSTRNLIRSECLSVILQNINLNIISKILITHFVIITWYQDHGSLFSTLPNLIDTVIRKSPKYSVSINSKIFLITTKRFDGNFIRKMCDTKNSTLGDT